MMIQRKTIVTASSVLAILALGLVAAPAVRANHRAGQDALPEALKAGDFDGDGKLDLVVINSGFDQVAFLKGGGDGSFTLQGHVLADTLPNGLDVGDFNEDGRLDFVMTSIWGYTDLRFLGDGGGGFARVRGAMADEPDHSLLRDINNDGHLDLLVTETTDAAMVAYLGEGEGGKFGDEADFAVFTTPSGIATADFNADGNLDAVLTSLQNTVIAIMQGDGLGGFTKLPDVNVVDTATSVAVGDYNEDGKMDVIAAGGRPTRSGYYFSVFDGDGAGNLTLNNTVTLGTGRGKGDVETADLNEDGHLDLVFPPSLTNLEVWVFFGDGTGHFGPKNVFPVGNEPHGVLIADFNVDGHKDIAVTNRTDGTVTILLGDGAGGFTVFGTFTTV